MLSAIRTIVVLVTVALILALAAMYGSYPEMHYITMIQ